MVWRLQGNTAARAVAGKARMLPSETSYGLYYHEAPIALICASENHLADRLLLALTGSKRLYLEGLGTHSGEGNGTNSSTLAWKIPWTKEPGGLPSMGSHRVGHN